MPNLTTPIPPKLTELQEMILSNKKMGDGAY